MILLWIAHLLVVISAVTDEQYASMPKLFEVDDYDTCMMLGKKSFYCSVSYRVVPLNAENPTEIWKIIKEVSSSELHYQHDLLRRLICIPQTCPNVQVYNESDPIFLKELTNCLDEDYKKMELHGTVEEVHCKSSNPIYEIDTIDLITAAVFIFYMVFVLAVSFYDMIRRNKTYEDYTKFKQSNCGKLVTTFSIPSNWNKLTSTPTGPDFEKLRGVQGIRVYMTIVVIGVHTAVALVASPILNPRYTENMNDFPDFASEFPRRGVYILTFHFMMSTWMLINSMLAKVDRNEEVDFKFVMKSLLKRYVRFTPTVALIVGFFATWFRHIPAGPFWLAVCEETERCRKNWWLNMFFVQNHIDRYNMCHIVSWFLAVEMQYYIIASLLLMILLKNRHRILPVIGFLIVLNMFFTFLDHRRHGYPSTLSSKPEEVFRVLFNKRPQWHDHFASYHASAAGSILGLGFGYVYYETRDKTIFTKKIHVILWWILSLGFLGLVSFFPSFYNVDQTPTHSAIWVALTRPLYAAGMGLLVLGMAHGQGGYLRRMLEWGPLNGLAKLSYCVYIGHTVFQNIRVGMMRTPEFVNQYTFVTHMLSDVAIAFPAAVWLTLFFEMPSNELANMMFKVKKNVEKKKN
ncbi:O-acyltransferase like protein isoform X2 [Leptinotarsa decemlineata]